MTDVTKRIIAIKNVNTGKYIRVHSSGVISADSEDIHDDCVFMMFANTTGTYSGFYSFLHGAWLAVDVDSHYRVMCIGKYHSGHPNLGEAYFKLVQAATIGSGVVSLYTSWGGTGRYWYCNTSDDDKIYVETSSQNPPDEAHYFFEIQELTESNAIARLGIALPAE